jgi:hypothetical protein
LLARAAGLKKSLMADAAYPHFPLCMALFRFGELVREAEVAWCDEMRRTFDLQYCSPALCEIDLTGRGIPVASCAVNLNSSKCVMLLLHSHTTCANIPIVKQ